MSKTLIKSSANTHGRLYRQVINKLMNYIQEQGLGPGDALPSESKLAQQFDVSVTTVRTAIKSLEGQGVLVSRHGCGVFVRPFSIDRLVDEFIVGHTFSSSDLTDMYEIRFYLELSVVGSIIHGITPEQIDHFQNILARMKVTPADSDVFDAL